MWKLENTVQVSILEALDYHRFGVTCEALFHSLLFQGKSFTGLCISRIMNCIVEEDTQSKGEKKKKEKGEMLYGFDG